MTTTLTISEALKTELVSIKEDEDLASLNATILHVMRNPIRGSRHIAGYDDTLTEPVKVDEFTRHVVQRVRDREGLEDYEAVIRDRAGIEPRDTGEAPIDVRPLN